MSGCPICERGEPLDVIAARRYTWITAGANSPSPGYVCMVNKRHVVERFELEGQERAAFYQRFDDPPPHDVEAIRKALA